MQVTISQNGKGLSLTYHAQKRMAQRNISPAELEFVLEHGKRLHRAGAIFYYMRRSDIPASLHSNSAISRLEGVTVVLSVHQTEVITVYRNRQTGLKRIKSKSFRSTRMHEGNLVSHNYFN